MALRLPLLCVAVLGAAIGCAKRELPQVITPPPAPTAIVPAAGAPSGGASATITGTGFATGATVRFGATPGTNVTVDPATSTIVVTVPSGSIGIVDVIVTNPDGQSGRIVNGYAYGAPPTLTAINPALGLIAGGTTVTLSGTAFQAGASVTLGGVACTNVSLVNGTTLVGTTGAHAVGLVNVTVTNPDTQSVTLTNGYLYTTTPGVTAIAPASGFDTGGTAVTITGSGFAPGATASIGGTALTGLTVVSPTSLTGVTAAHVVGVYGVTVTNPGPYATTLANAYSYIYGPNRQTAQFTWEVSTGIDRTRRWLVETNWAAFRTDMQNRGLQTATASDAVNAYAIDWLRAYILQGVNVAYGRNADGTKVSGTSVNVTFVGLTPASGTPGGTGSGDYSRMCIGGTSSSGAGVLGTAWLDSGTPCGNSTEDDCLGTQFGGSGSTLGVFTASISTTSLSPALAQTDQPYLDGSVTTGTRYNDIHARLIGWAYRIAYVTSHEIGHSMGLVGSALTGSCSGGSQCGASGAHNNCCGTNIMAASASFSGVTSFTARAFSGQGVSASSTCHTAGLSSWGMLTSWHGTSP